VVLWHYGGQKDDILLFRMRLPVNFFAMSPHRDRSRYVADTLARSLRGQQEELARACDIANQNLDALMIEREFDVISGEIAGPWNDSPTR
jgi:hypothetical protein